MIVKMPHSCYVENCSNNEKSPLNLNFYILPSDIQAMVSTLAASNWSGTTVSKFLHFFLVDQLYAKEEYFRSFMTKSN